MTSPAFAHTPYDSSNQPFSIGLSPMAADEWIEADAALADYLAEKDRLQQLHPEKVFVEEPHAREAQQEILDSIIAYLQANYPALYGFKEGRIEVKPAGRSVKLNEPDIPALLTAARLVQEDLVIMRKGETGWRLAAASLSFPSSWSLGEKFGQPMHEIHAPVPGFSAGTRNAGLIERLFDNLRPGNPVKRYNWSIYSDGELYHPASSGERDPNPERAFIRVERQTLRKMPISGDILFTIRIHLDPLATLNKHPERALLATSLATQLSALSPEQLAYKGLTANRDGLVKHLHSIAL
jgi:dimethylamine monooxygenase subunit A